MEQADSREPIVAVDRARIEFGPLVAVRDVSFALQPGNLLGLIGPNGAGKTTLLRAVAGMQMLAGGSIRVLGHDLSHMEREAFRQIGFTPDNPSFYDALTVREFLEFIAIGYGLSAAEANDRIVFWLEKVWLSEKANQKVKSLSRGMRQRVGLARTLLPNPSVILLDEPAAGLDPAGRVQFRQLLCDLRDQGKVLIVSSHILAEMEEYCTHVGIMAHGAMVRFGTVAQVSAHGNHSDRCRYTIVLARAFAGLDRTLAEIDGVGFVEVERDRATFEFASGRERAAELLGRLVELKVPLASFVPQAAGLEEAYLRIGIGQVD